MSRRSSKQIRRLGLFITVLLLVCQTANAVDFSAKNRKSQDKVGHSESTLISSQAPGIDTCSGVAVVTLPDTIFGSDQFSGNASLSAESAKLSDFGVADSGTQLPEIDISGFMDIVATYQDRVSDHTNFSLGEAELDFSMEPSRRIQITASAALNSEEDKIDLCQATVGFDLFKGRRGFFSTGYIMAGLFDVPFGIDYQCNCSPTRKFSTAPLAVELTHGGWQDHGVALKLGGRRCDVTTFLVNGFTPSEEVMAHVVHLTTELEDSVDVTPANAFGSRVGINLSEQVQVGGSIAVGLNKSSQDEMILAGIDAQLTLGKLGIRGEYLFHSISRSLLRRDNHGFYVQPTLHLGNFYATSRYDQFKGEGLEQASQIVAGCGYRFIEGVELRFESTIANVYTDNRTSVQVFAGF